MNLIKSIEKMHSKAAYKGVNIYVQHFSMVVSNY